MNTNNKCEEKQDILNEVEFIREVMISTAFKEGITSKNAIRMSMILDRLLNEIQKLKCL
ncbi:MULTISPECIES: aspartyl-phosphate phosphatase Spo0E family protein [Priestia]|nr:MULTISPECIES: aspartyl-phosphate phosphatase Spo0E family protein [Priestia]MCU7741403.1 aspartyl-phosphate phosphatase Spo0E family protein [Priestia megaterium]MDG0032097.1 aspartyl-phosphate phosphatase Spo0E family protein [Priestia sp. Y58]MDG0060099.1 aspartyl-phosphate phosphatase Spo0E family protein [Priestia sp. P5]UYV54734.1 aspartyl-phosphate phosphatase Spo0E family protein [Priestia megaterium]WDC91159.1 aspartyl-phosphate phosphatase Spo0E family protein [Priestia megaterium]